MMFAIICLMEILVITLEALNKEIKLTVPEVLHQECYWIIQKVSDIEHGIPMVTIHIRVRSSHSLITNMVELKNNIWWIVVFEVMEQLSTSLW